MKTTKDSKEKLERFRQADEEGWYWLNRYLDHLDNCKSCADHYSVWSE